MGDVLYFCSEEKYSYLKMHKLKIPIVIQPEWPFWNIPVLHPSLTVPTASGISSFSTNKWRPWWSHFLYFFDFISDQERWQECPGLDNSVSLVLYSRLALQFTWEEAGSSELLYIYYISIDFWTIFIPETTYSYLKVDSKTELFLLVSEW